MEALALSMGLARETGELDQPNAQSFVSRGGGLCWFREGRGEEGERAIEAAGSISSSLPPPRPGPLLFLLLVGS